MHLNRIAFERSQAEAARQKAEKEEEEKRRSIEERNKNARGDIQRMMASKSPLALPNNITAEDFEDLLEEGM